MTATYPSVDQWVIAEGVFRQTLAGVRLIGQSGKEAGAFWLGSRETTAHVDSVVLPHGIGVEEHRGRWAVSPEVFAVITRWAKPRNLCLLAVVHTHVRGVPPVLSWTDRNLGIRVPGMLAAVIGNGGDDSDHLKWGWYVFETDDYKALSEHEIGQRISVDAAGKFEVWAADANGVQLLRT
jgi:hypothetical protein